MYSFSLSLSLSLSLLWVLTSRQLVIPCYQNITFNGIILKLYSTNITCDCTFVTFSGSLIYFLTFDGSIVTLSNTNITFYCTFLTFGGTLIFFSYLIVILSHWTIPTSYVTVVLLHSVVPLFFSHI